MPLPTQTMYRGEGKKKRKKIKPIKSQTPRKPTQTAMSRRGY